MTDGTRVTVRDRVLAFVRAEKKPQCGRCIAQATGILESQVQRALLVLEGLGYRRRSEACARCGKTRLIMHVPR